MLCGYRVALALAGHFRRPLGPARRTLAGNRRLPSFRQEALKLETGRPPDILGTPTTPRREKKKSGREKKSALLPSFRAAADGADLATLGQMDEEADRFLSAVAGHLEEEKEVDKPTKVNWDAAMQAIREAEQRFPLRYFDTEELGDLQEKCITYNLSKVVNDSRTLKKLVDLGVALAEWERKENDWTDLALRLDFDADVAPRVRILADHVPAGMIGGILTKNAPLLLEDLDHLKTRVSYLRHKKFTGRMIRDILCENPYWLTYSTEEIDSRLGYFQKTFDLTGDEVRGLATNLPKLITWGGVPGQININNFTLKEVCGFKESEMKRMLLRFPSLYYQKYEKVISDMFDLLHNEVGFPHRLLRKSPEVLVRDAVACRPRHLFLKEIGRAQYNPELPLYISPPRLVFTEEVEFCSEVAGMPVALYNEFLKTV